MKEHLILALLWVAFCFLHSFLAARRVKAKLKTSMGNRFRYYRLLYTLFAFVTFSLIIWYQVHMPQEQLYQVTKPVLFSGLVLGFSGLVLMGICISKYFMGLSGVKSLFEEKPSSKLIITGVHRFVRHPLYLGTFAFIWGFFLLQPFLSLLISNFIITAYTLVGIRFEETKLVEEFGSDYQEYRRKVPKILPFRLVKDNSISNRTKDPASQRG